ncbi:MAG: hypothetical protein Q8Q83_19440, partial [Pseudomonas sp.]|nr:hypothetical protein [Pseudomonas sp.]
MLRKLWAVLLASFISGASAEGFYVLTPIATSIKRLPEVDVLFRIVDIVGDGYTEIPNPAPNYWCSVQPKSTRRPGPDKCFDIDLWENDSEVKILSQHILKYDNSIPSAYLLITYVSQTENSLPQDVRIAIDTGTSYSSGNIYNAY